MKLHKSAFLGLAMAAIAALGTAACDDDTEVIVTPPTPAISVTPPALTLNQGETGQVSAVVSGLTDKTVSFSSTNPAVATVNGSGTVTAVSGGSATIVVTSNADATLKGSVPVTVIAPPVEEPDPITVQVLPPSATIDVNGTVQLQAVVNGSSQGVTWSSVDSNIASVNTNTGMVTGVAPGNTTIIATSQEDGTAIGTSNITVRALPDVGITLSPATSNIVVGGSVVLSANISGTTQDSVNFFVADSGSVVTLTRLSRNSVRVNAIATGTAVVRAVSAADPTKSATATVVVAPKADINVTVTPSTLSIVDGDTARLNVDYTGTTGVGEITYASTNTAVVTVDTTGLITAVAPGNAVVRVTVRDTSDNRTASATTAVTVTAPPQATVTIASITQGLTLVPVNPNNVAGQIEVNVNADLPTGFTGTVEVLVDSTAVCTQTVTAPPSAQSMPLVLQQIQCSIQTADYTIQGNGQATVDFLNGAHTITARVNGTAGNANVNATTSTTLTFRNPDTWVGDLDVIEQGNVGTTTDALGQQWDAGDVVLYLYPLMYSGRTPVSVTAQFDALPVKTDANGADGWILTWDNATAIGAGGSMGFASAAAGTSATIIQWQYANGEIMTPAASVASGNDADIDNDGFADAIVPPLDTKITDLELPGLLVRVDNFAPTGGLFILLEQETTANQSPSPNCCNDNWVGPNYNLSAGFSGAADVGVGLPGATALSALDTIYVDTTGSTTIAGIRANGIAMLPGQFVNAVLNPSDTTVTNFPYTAAAVYGDRLDNRSTVLLTTTTRNPRTVGGAVDATPAPGNGTQAFFGYDTYLMTVTPTGPATGTTYTTAGAFAGTTFTLTYLDNKAGFTDGRYTAVPANEDHPAYGTVVFNLGAACLVGGAGCAPVVFGEATPGVAVATNTTTNMDISALAGGEGYYTFNAWVHDRAGNITGVAPRTVLYDATAPTVSNPVFPTGGLTGGTAHTFQARINDNVDGEWVAFGQDFDAIAFGTSLGTFYIPTQNITYGDGFAGTRFTSTVVSANPQFIRSIELTGVGGAPVGAVNSPTDVVWQPRDVAGNLMNPPAQYNYAGGTVPAGTPITGVTSFNLAVSGAFINVSSAAPLTQTMTARVVCNTSTCTPPFAYVNFYRQVNAGAAGYVRLLGASSAPISDDTGATRAWNYTFVWDAQLPTEPAGTQLFAVGVQSDGDALKSPNLAGYPVNP